MRKSASSINSLCFEFSSEKKQAYIEKQRRIHWIARPIPILDMRLYDMIKTCGEAKITVNGGLTMDKDQLAQIIQQRLGLSDEEFKVVGENPKYENLVKNAIEGSRYRLVAEVVESKGCHSGHEIGQRIIFDSAGNLLTRESPERVCAFLMPNLTVLINAFFENLMNGRNPNEVMFNRTGCFDVGHACGGWGHVRVEMKAELRE